MLPRASIAYFRSSLQLHRKSRAIRCLAGHLPPLAFRVMSLVEQSESRGLVSTIPVDRQQSLHPGVTRQQGRSLTCRSYSRSACTPQIGFLSRRRIRSPLRSFYATIAHGDITIPWEPSSCQRPCSEAHRGWIILYFVRQQPTSYVQPLAQLCCRSARNLNLFGGGALLRILARLLCVRRSIRTR